MESQAELGAWTSHWPDRCQPGGACPIMGAANPKTCCHHPEPFVLRGLMQLERRLVVIGRWCCCPRIRLAGVVLQRLLPWGWPRDRRRIWFGLQGGVP